jgi:hypothetical protein
VTPEGRAESWPEFWRQFGHAGAAAQFRMILAALLTVTAAVAFLALAVLLLAFAMAAVMILL